LTITILAVALTASTALNIALVIFARWQHTIIKQAADELGVSLT
jgi:hypothetical protein